jgi:hypothetical protein
MAPFEEDPWNGSSMLGPEAENQSQTTFSQQNNVACVVSELKTPAA